jgi:hypothetical protein
MALKQFQKAEDNSDKTGEIALKTSLTKSLNHQKLLT